MAPKGMSADAVPTDLPEDIREVERTHRLHREIGAPDIRPDPAWHLLGASVKGEVSESRRAVLAAQQAKENSIAFRRSLDRPRVCGRGHDLTDPTNVYVGKKGSQCRECRNASYRKAA